MRAAMVEVGHVWKGEPVTVKGRLLPPDRSVGIMGPSLEYVHVYDMEGKEIVLSDEEMESLLDSRSLWESVDVRYHGGE